MKTKTVYVVRFEHCSDSDCNRLKRASTKRGALIAACGIILENLNRCETVIAERIKAAVDNRNYEQAVDLFIAEQEAGGDCLLNIDKV